MPNQHSQDSSSIPRTYNTNSPSTSKSNPSRKPFQANNKSSPVIPTLVRPKESQKRTILSNASNERSSTATGASPFQSPEEIRRATLETSESALRLASAVIIRRRGSKTRRGCVLCIENVVAVCRGRRCSRRIDRVQCVPTKDKDKERRGITG